MSEEKSKLSQQANAVERRDPLRDSSTLVSCVSSDPQRSAIARERGNMPSGEVVLGDQKTNCFLPHELTRKSKR